MRRKMIEEDLVECVIGLGPNLFYNSPMEACLLITKTDKGEKEKGKILFINAVNEVRQDKTMGFLEQKHIDKIFKAYKAFTNKKDFATLMTNDDVLKKNGNMAINLYIRPEQHNPADSISFEGAYTIWEDSSTQLKNSMKEFFKVLEN